jgi:hypothetical protein
MNALHQSTSGTDIDASISHDGGMHWSNPVLVSQGPGGIPAARDQFWPAITADPGGEFHVIWLDNRLDPGNKLINTFQADSTDDGHTWPNRRISTKSWNPDLGFFTSGAFAGDYIGIASNAKATYPIWTDGRNTAIATTGIGETDIFTNIELR